MMFTTSLLALALAGGALAQTTASPTSATDSATLTSPASGSASPTSAGGDQVASLFPIEFQSFDLEGSVIGSGTDGTTYVLSPTEGGFTVTLVEDSTHVSETVDIATGGTTADIIAECGLAGGAAVCTENLILGSQSTVIQLTTVASLVGANVGGSIASTPTSSQSVLGPSITVSSPSTSSNTVATVTNAVPTTTTSSAAAFGKGLPLGGVAAAVAAVLAHIL